jgi:putative membrane protein
LGVRDGKTAAALLEAVRECGRILADHFPADNINENELADGLVVLEKGE